MSPDVMVKKSGIEGKGVFAARDFRKGEVVLRWENVPALTPGQVDKLPEEEKKYVTYTGGKALLLPSPGRYVNHSCDANTYIRNL